MINGYDFDISHDEDYYDFGSEYLELDQDYGECIIGENSEDEEDKYVNYKNKNRNDIINCFKFLNEKEPEFEIDLNKGLTQMVEKNIEKMRNLPFYVNNEIIEVLMIAEKPSLAKIITYVLREKNFKVYTENGLTIYTYEGRFKGKKAFFTISSIRGHIYQNNFMNYKHYDDDINDLYDEKIVKNLKRNTDDNNKKKELINIPKFLRNIAKGKDILCLWLDCDPEGENICFEVIYNVLPYMNKRNYQQIYRAQFNSLTKRDIRQSFENLEDYPDKNISMSVDARSIIDFKVGVCFTRLFSDEILDYIEEYDGVEKKKKILSYGPCQTPTLWFCVQRAKEKKRHKKSSYYKIYIEIEDDDGIPYKLYYEEKYNKTELNEELNKMKFYFCAELTSINYINKRKLPPPGLKTTTMLKMASLQLGLSPYDASKTAQNLYMGGYISYPRTSSTKYSENFDFQESLEMFQDNPYFSEKVNKLLYTFDKSQINFSIGEEKGGHQTIVPTKSLDGPIIGKAVQWDLYKCICLYYFASLSPQMEYENMECEFYLGKYKFTKTFSKIKKKGFLNFLTHKTKNFVKKFPSFTLGKSYKIINLDYVHVREPSPEYLTEAELIDEMEKQKIGTDGSIPSHIRNLTLRKYVKVDRHKRIRPTKLGITLIDSLNKIIPEIVLPENRAQIELFVKQVQTGEKSYEDAIKSALEFYKKKLTYCSSNIYNVRKGFGKYFHLKEEKFI